MEKEKLSSAQIGAFTRLKNQFKNDFELLMADIEAKRDQLEEMRVLLMVDDDEGTSVQSQIFGVREQANENLEKISSLLEDIEEKHQLITAPSDGFYPDIQSVHQDITEIYEECSELIKQFKASSDLLYGEESNGLENKLEILAKSYEESLTLSENKSAELIVQIQGALAGATNVELAKAFQDQKTSYKYPKYGWTTLFIATIAVMIYLGLDAAKLSSEGSHYLYDLSKRLMVFAPLVWLALFSSKQQAQNKRLQEEYAHKEAVTKTYVGHQKQLEKLGESAEKNNLLIQLARTTIDTIDYNPSSTLEKTNPKKELPAAELLDLVKQALDKIGK